MGWKTGVRSFPDAVNFSFQNKTQLIITNSNNGDKIITHVYYFYTHKNNTQIIPFYG